MTGLLYNTCIISINILCNSFYYDGYTSSVYSR